MSSFFKYHSLGNDFILIAGNRLLEPELAQALCDRQRGVGADGILIYRESENSNEPIQALVQNADGSDGSFSGNGLRCLADYFLRKHDATGITIMMAGKPMLCTKKEREIVTAIPRGSCHETVEIVHDKKNLIGYRVDVGNPHLIIFENVHRSWLEQHGPFFARYGDVHANVTFVKRCSNVLFTLTFERGVGLTQSCSSAAAALTTLCAELDVTPEAHYTVHMPGGSVSTSINNQQITLRAQAYQAFIGEFFASALIESYKSAYRN
jgi:diaminopimelate epimerase